MAKQVKYYSHNQPQSQGWETDKPSMTVMGESWTIRELVDKYASGQIEPDQNVSYLDCLLYTSPSPRDCRLSRMPSSA